MRQSKSWIILFFAAAIVLISFQTVLADVISIPHQACLPKQHWGGSTITNYHSNGASVQPFPGSGDQTLYCPVILPQGATIKNIQMECHDGSGGASGGYVAAALASYQYNTTSISANFDSGSEDAPGAVRISVENINLVVDNTQYHYGLSVTMNNPTGDSGAISFSKFIVEYEPPATKNKVVVVPLFK